MTRHACPECRCADDGPHPPATSSTWARRQAQEAVAQAIRDAKVKGGRT